MARTAGDYFGERATTYDSSIRRGHPCYEEMLLELVRTLPSSADQVLELGCGTGALSVRLVERYPEAELTLVDAAPEMLRVARQRLEPAGLSRVRFMAGTFEELSLPQGGFDLITSSMSLHHIVDKAPIYGRARGWLRSGGLLVFADEVTGAVPYVKTLHWNDWLEFARLPGHLSEDEITDIVRHGDELDHYETLARQLELLSAADFQPVDCAWRQSNYGIFVAQA